MSRAVAKCIDDKTKRTAGKGVHYTRFLLIVARKA